MSLNINIKYASIPNEFHAFFIRAGVKEAIIKCQLIKGRINAYNQSIGS